MLSRRRVFGRAVGVAVAGAAGGSVLTEVLAVPAQGAQATSVEQGAVAPTVVALTDAATIAIDASLGNDYRVTLGGDRAMGDPSNPVDGQQIILQVTQGTGGSFALSWGSEYTFPAGAPALSTAAGDTDLLQFVYDAAQGQWLLAGFVNGFSPRQSSSGPTSSGGSYRLFPATNGPATASSYSGDYLAGVSFSVTEGGIWFQGYWWWVCGSGQQTGAQKFALWQITGSTTGIVIPGSVVTSGTLAAGQWNYVPLPSPIPLSISTAYMAATGFACTAGFPSTDNQFGPGEPYASGITNGPLFAYGSNTALAHSVAQGAFGTSSADPSSVMPGRAFSNANFWMDLQVTDVAPAGACQRLWPNQPVPYNWQPDTPTANWTLGTEFTLSQDCSLDRIWFYSPPGAGQLPTECGIWEVSTQALVAGTSNSSPSWSGTAGSGWVSCSYAGVTLPAGDYKVTVFNGAQTPQMWSATTYPYWSSPGFGASGITAGPLTAPGDATATRPGQSTYQQATTFVYPDTYASSIGSATYWVDVQVTPPSPYRLFPGTSGPSTADAYTGQFIAGVTFGVTSEAWFEGYWWWVCETGQSTAPTKCCLYSVSGGTGNETVVPGSVVTSGELTAGQWNWIPLETPLALALGSENSGAQAAATYIAAIGCNGGPFPITNNQFGSGQPYAAGITNGPLCAFSDQSGSLPAQYTLPQGTFTVAGNNADPTTACPRTGFNSANFWVDVKLSSVAPVGSSYRIWPNMIPTVGDTADNLEQTFGTQFTLSQSCTLKNIWYYSPPAVTPAALPTQCGIFSTATQEIVPGTYNTSPSWSGVAGSGWAACSYANDDIVLSPGTYIVAVFTTGGSQNFYNEINGYFLPGSGAGSVNGIVNGPISVARNACAPYSHGSAWTYPTTMDSNGQCRFVDVEVIPSSS